MLERIRNLLTPEQRKALYIALGAVGVFLMAMGWLTPELIQQVQGYLVVITGLLVTLGNFIAALNVPKNPDAYEPSGDVYPD